MIKSGTLVLEGLISGLKLESLFFYHSPFYILYGTDPWTLLL